MLDVAQENVRDLMLEMGRKARAASMKLAIGADHGHQYQGRWRCGPGRHDEEHCRRQRWAGRAGPGFHHRAWGG